MSKKDVDAHKQKTKKHQVLQELEGMKITDRKMRGFTGEVSTTRIEGFNKAIEESIKVIERIL